jgi:hypothetical protein
MKLFNYPAPIIKAPKKIPKLGKRVTFPVSYRYNGGTFVDGEWYDGFFVPPPVVPDGYELVGMGCGLQMNCRPPYVTLLLVQTKPTTESE